MKSISHDEALRKLFAERPEIAEAYVKELKREIKDLEAENADLRRELKAVMERS